MSTELILGYIFSGFVLIAFAVYALDRWIVYKHLSDKLERSEERRYMAESNRDIWESEARRYFQKWQKEKARHTGTVTSQKVNNLIHNDNSN